MTIYDFFQIVLFEYLQVLSGSSSCWFFRSTVEIVVFCSTHSTRRKKRSFWQSETKIVRSFLQSPCMTLTSKCPYSSFLKVILISFIIITYTNLLIYTWLQANQEFLHQNQPGSHLIQGVEIWPLAFGEVLWSSESIRDCSMQSELTEVMVQHVNRSLHSFHF